MNTLIANIGQYPGRCVPGQRYTIKQALVYTKSATETARVTLIFHVNINTITGLRTPLQEHSIAIYPNPSNTSFKIVLPTASDITVHSLDGKQCLSYKGISNLEFGNDLEPGMYMVKVGNIYCKIVKE